MPTPGGVPTPQTIQQADSLAASRAASQQPLPPLQMPVMAPTMMAPPMPQFQYPQMGGMGGAGGGFGMAGFGMAGFGGGFGGGGGNLSAQVMPSIPGLAPSGYSSLFGQGVQLPKDLMDNAGARTTTTGQPNVGLQETQKNVVCCLYVQVLELTEEISRLNEVNSGYIQDLELYKQKFDRLMAQEETIYVDFFRQKATFEEEKAEKDKILAEKSGECNNLTSQVASLREQLSSKVVGGGEGGKKAGVLLTICFVYVDRCRGCMWHTVTCIKYPKVCLSSSIEHCKKWEECQSFEVERSTRNVQDGFLHPLQLPPGNVHNADKKKIVDLLQRVALLEQEESKMARKYLALEAEHKSCKHALDNLEAQVGETEAYLKGKVTSLTLWKQRAENSLKMASKKISDMVPASEYERVNRQLQVCAHREMDLLRRQSELYVTNAQREDRLRDMLRLEDRNQDFFRHFPAESRPGAAGLVAKIAAVRSSRDRRTVHLSFAAISTTLLCVRHERVKLIKYVVVTRTVWCDVVRTRTVCCTWSSVLSARTSSTHVLVLLPQTQELSSKLQVGGPESGSRIDESRSRAGAAGLAAEINVVRREFRTGVRRVSGSRRGLPAETRSRRRVGVRVDFLERIVPKNFRFLWSRSNESWRNDFYASISVMIAEGMIHLSSRRDEHLTMIGQLAYFLSTDLFS